MPIDVDLVVVNVAEVVTGEPLLGEGPGINHVGAVLEGGRLVHETAR